MEGKYAVHHFTVSVRDIDTAASFYGVFGFRLALRWTAPDRSLSIAHLANGDGLILEMFQYADNQDRALPELEAGNNLRNLGVKHIAFRVPDVSAARAELLSMRCGGLTEIQHGRTGVEYFFISDPDGNWVEILQDYRSLDPEHPTILTGT